MNIATPSGAVAGFIHNEYGIVIPEALVVGIVCLCRIFGETASASFT